MSILVNAGRAALAMAIKNSVLHLAWGRGVSTWDATRTDALTLDSTGSASLFGQGIRDVVVKSADGAHTYALGTDYTLSPSGAVVRMSSGTIASGASLSVTYRNVPFESPAAVALVSEIGRKKVTEVRFVTPDDSGELAMTTGRFSFSDTATRHILFRTSFEYSEGEAETIREVGIFMATVAKPSVPPGQFYLLPPDVADPGILLLLQNMTPIVRNGATQQSFDSVLTL